MNVSVDTTTAGPAWKGDLVSLALELQALESETFEVQDYAGVNDMSTAVGVTGGSSTSSSCSSCCSTCSTTSTCA